VVTSAEMVDKAPESPAPAPSRSRFSMISVLEKYGVLVALGIEIVVFGLLTPNFLGSGNINTILSSQSVLLVVALGLILSLAVGEFDLSLGAVLGFACILTAYFNVMLEWPIVISIIATLILSALFGLFNGFLSVIVGVPSIITTLGTGTLLTGLALGVSGSQIISGIDPAVVDFMTKPVLFKLPVPFYFSIVLTIVIWFVFQHTPIGRYMVFTAENREVARLAGINERALRIGGLVATSFIAGIAGVILVCSLGAADPTVGASFLLPAFAAAFLGSTTIVPGRFNAIGTLVAVYFLITGIVGLQLLGLAGWVEQVFYGASLILAVTLSQLAGKRRIKPAD